MSDKLTSYNSRNINSVRAFAQQKANKQQREYLIIAKDWSFDGEDFTDYLIETCLLDNTRFVGVVKPEQVSDEQADYEDLQATYNDMARQW